MKNIGLNNDEKNWLLTLYSNLKKRSNSDDTINTIFTPKQIIKYCFDITKYLSITISAEDFEERIHPKLIELYETEGFSVRNIQHGFNQGDITVEDLVKDEELVKFDINYTMQSSFSFDGNNSTSLSCDFYGGGYFCDSWGDYDVMPLNDFLFNASAGTVEIGGEEYETILDYIKNHFVILVLKTASHNDDNNSVRIGYVDGGTYSIYNSGQEVTIPSVGTGNLYFGEFPNNPESTYFQLRDSNAIISYDETIPASDPENLPEEPSPIDIVENRIDYAVSQAQMNKFNIMRGDFSYFDDLEDIKIQLPEKQADILTHFRKYIN